MISKFVKLNKSVSLTSVSPVWHFDNLYPKFLSIYASVSGGKFGEPRRSSCIQMLVPATQDPSV